MKAVLIIWYIEHITSYGSTDIGGDFKQLSINDFVVTKSAIKKYVARVSIKGDYRLFVGYKTLINRI